MAGHPSVHHVATHDQILISPAVVALIITSKTLDTLLQ